MASKIYGLYNVKENEQCEYFGTREEIADYLGVKPDSVSAFLTRKKNGVRFLMKHKYDLVEMENNDE